MRGLFRMRCPAPPHDLLKLVDWPGHDNEKAARGHLPAKFMEKCPGLWNWIRHHRKRKSYLIPDILSAAIARYSMRYNYWDVSREGWGTEDPFLVKVFGDVVYWPEGKRRDTFNRIISLYVERGEDDATNAEANELLADYPQDSRFPVVGLKVHHYLSWALRGWWLKGKLRDADVVRMWLVCLTVPPLPLAHRLKDLRAYRRKRRDYLRALRALLKEYRPMSIGDELWLVMVDREDVDTLLERLARTTKMDIDITVYEYEISRREFLIYDGERRPYRCVSSYHVSTYSLGEAVEWGASAGSASWARHLNRPYVAWIFISPKHDLIGSAEEFVEYAEREVLSKMEREKLPEKIESEIPVSPDILVAVAEGYGEFLSALADSLGILPEDVVFVSFDQTLFIRGLREPEQAVRLYTKADDVRARLHISTALTIVATEPKHPFWHVLRLIGADEEFSGVIFALGGKIVRLRDEDIQLLRQVTRSLRNVSRRAFYRIVRMSRRQEPEALKFEIEGMAQDGKLPEPAAQKLCWLIDQLRKKYRDKVQEVLPQALRALAPWTRREGGR